MPRADTSEENMTTFEPSRNCSATRVRCACDLRECISRTEISHGNWASASAYSCVWRAVGKKTTILCSERRSSRSKWSSSAAWALSDVTMTV